MNNPQITVTITEMLMKYVSRNRDPDCRNTSDFVRRLLCEAVAHRSDKAAQGQAVGRGRPAVKRELAKRKAART
jgi:hypothetical protein